MSFRDGNDPTKAPGATVIYPVPTGNFIFDGEQKLVVDRETGERLGLRISDREDNMFHATITNTSGGPFIAFGFIGRLERPDFGTTRAYNIVNVIRFTDDGPVDVDYPVERIAEFLNAHPDYFAAHEFIGHVVVVDNRRIWRGM